MDSPTHPASSEEPRERSLLADVLTYPIRGGGVWMILIGAGLSILLTIASTAPLIGIVAGLFSMGFFASYYLDTINTTVNDKDDPPDWPDITNFVEDIGRPLIQTLGVSVISLSLLFLTLGMDEDNPAKLPCMLGALAFAAFYFPMASLGLVTHGHLGGAMPHRVFPAIFRALPGYLGVVAMFAGLMILSALSDTVGSKVPVVGVVITAAPTMYLLMAQGRLIGLLYRAKREQIGWG